MSLKKHILPFFSFILMFSFGNINAQLLHPGDVNNNGIVNGADALYWATVNGNTGAARNSPDSNFVPQIIDDLWPDTFANGISHAYADCDGNGIIDDLDLNDFIIKFLYEEHMFSAGTNDPYSLGTDGVDPKILLEPSVNSVEEGGNVDIAVSLNSVDGSDIEGIYGVTFIMEFAPRFVDRKFVYNPPSIKWIGDDDDISATIFSKIDEGIAEMTIVRKDRSSISGSGNIGSFNIIIEDIVVGLVDRDTLEVEIINIILIDEEFQTKPLAPSTAKIEVTASSTSTTNPLTNKFQVYPNPFEREFIIERSNDIDINELTLINPLGKTIPISFDNATDKKIKIRLQEETAPGIYFLQIKTDKGVALKTVKIDF